MHDRTVSSLFVLSTTERKMAEGDKMSTVKSFNHRTSYETLEWRIHVDTKKHVWGWWERSRIKGYDTGWQTSHRFGLTKGEPPDKCCLRNGEGGWLSYGRKEHNSKQRQSVSPELGVYFTSRTFDDRGRWRKVYCCPMGGSM